MSEITYHWVKVSDLQTDWHIHIDSASQWVNADHRIMSIVQVGENVLEIVAVRDSVFDNPPIILHRKPTDEVSVFGVTESRTLRLKPRACI